MKTILAKCFGAVPSLSRMPLQPSQITWINHLKPQITAITTGLFHNPGMPLIYAQNRSYPTILAKAYHHHPNVILFSEDEEEQHLGAILKLAEHMVGLPSLFSATTTDYEWEQYELHILDILAMEKFQLLETRNDIKPLE